MDTDFSEFLYDLNHQLEKSDQDMSSENITRTALRYLGGIALYCTRMFTHPYEDAAKRIQGTVTTLGNLFDQIAESLDAGDDETEDAAE